MEGLEVSVRRKSEVLADNPKQRMDSQYFSHAALAATAAIESKPFVRFGSIVDVFRKGIFDIKAESYTDQGDGVPFVRIGDLRSGLINQASTEWISAEAHQLEKKTALKFGDIILSKTAYPAAAFVNVAECNASQDTIAVKLGKAGRSEFKTGYIVAFLNSRIGMALMQREFQGNVQLHLSLDDGKKLPIPKLNFEFQTRIDELIRSVDALNVEREQALQHAETALLAALGLAGWTPPEPLSYTARAADALTAARLDAQYFRPKYNEAVALLHAKGNAAELGSLVSLNARGRQPIYADDGLPVINSKHVRTNHVNLGDDNRFGERGKSPVVIRQGDVLLNGTGVGTIGRAAPYVLEQDALPDNHVTVIRPNKIDPIYLSVFLNCSIGQLQIEQLIKGSSGQIELYPDDIAKIIIWDAPENVQSAVRDAVLSAKLLETRSRALLSAAKRAVEIAIEDGEAAALAWLEGLPSA